MYNASHFPYSRIYMWKWLPISSQDASYIVLPNFTHVFVHMFAGPTSARLSSSSSAGYIGPYGPTGAQRRAQRSAVWSGTSRYTDSHSESLNGPYLHSLHMRFPIVCLFPQLAVKLPHKFCPLPSGSFSPVHKVHPKSHLSTPPTQLHLAMILRVCNNTILL